MIYLDNAATTSVCPECREAVCSALQNCFGNPSSLYDLGLEASRLLERSRETVARAVGCGAGELFFTGCGTESNNIAVLGLARARKAWARRVVTTGYEHPSVGETVRALEDEGFETVFVKPRKDGTVDIDELLAAVDDRTALVAAMSVNNETGAVIDLPRLAGLVKEKNRRCAVHCDNVQGFLKHKTPLGDIDSMSISAHKVHGPKGIGALYLRKNLNIKTPYHGGGQEKGYRSGTENVPYAAGFAAAVESWGDMGSGIAAASAACKRLRERVAGLCGAVINSPVSASPYILNISLPGYKSETVMHFLEMRGIYVSSGSACSHGSSSRTLAAMGVSAAHADSALRISFTNPARESDADALADALEAAIKELVHIRV